LQDLLACYPRDVWQGHANLGEMAKFWLARHDMFRELGSALDGALAQFRTGAVPAGAFAEFFAPRLQFMLTQIEQHHHVEDAHYFPIFRAAERKLGKGFDLLDADHHVIHAAIGESAQAANDFLRALFEAQSDRMESSLFRGAGEVREPGIQTEARNLRLDSGSAPSARPGMTGALLRASDAYADVNARLLKILTRHLADEEDLIVPLILERGERKLGVG
jgi:hypothetical protein